MYPLISSTALIVLHEEVISDAQRPVMLAQQSQAIARPLALALGHTFITLGHRLERLGQ